MRRKAQRKLIVPFLAPALLIYAGFVVYPALQAFYVSLLDWGGFTTSATFVGTSNFTALSSDPVFWVSLWNNLLLLFLGGALVFGLSFLFTAVLRRGVRGRELARAVIFVPNIVALVAIAFVWGFIYNPRFGLLNGVLKAIGLDEFGSTAWMGPSLIRPAVGIVLIWVFVGFYTTIFVAAADRIPAEVLDASRIDGAGDLRVFWSITLPMIWDVVVIGMVLWVIDAMTQFDLVYVIGGAGQDPPLPIWTLSVYVYQEGFGGRTPIFNLGYATAIAVVLTLLVLVLVVVVRRLRRRVALEY